MFSDKYVSGANVTIFARVNMPYKMQHKLSAPFFPFCVVSSISFGLYMLCCFFAVVSVTVVTGTSTDTTVSPLSSESIRSDSSSKGRFLLLFRVPTVLENHGM